MSELCHFFNTDRLGLERISDEEVRDAQEYIEIRRQVESSQEAEDRANGLVLAQKRRGS